MWLNWIQNAVTKNINKRRHLQKIVSNYTSVIVAKILFRHSTILVKTKEKGRRWGLFLHHTSISFYGSWPTNGANKNKSFILLQLQRQLPIQFGTDWFIQAISESMQRWWEIRNRYKGRHIYHRYVWLWW